MLITEDFLLESKQAVELYQEYAESQPIIDYHCHLPPDQIASDHQFVNLSEIWLYGDHYKWRAMRANGIDESYITGNASDREKFQKWAETVPKTLRNPLYHWTHLELKTPFGISDRLLSPATAKGIWSQCNEILARPDFSCRGILKQMNVRVVCTTDDPVDSLEHHRKIAADSDFKIRVLPTFRPDKAMAVESPKIFKEWVEKLAAAADVNVNTFAKFMEALRKRHDAFHAIGCRLSDHGIETAYADDYTDAEIRAIFLKARAGKGLSADEISKFKSGMLYEFGLMDHEKDWTQQFHIGPLRNNNSRLLRTLGPDTGFDSIGDLPAAKPLSKFLDRLDSTNQLARTILYNVNPSHNEMYASMIGNFQDGTVAGKIQWGSAWWFMDQKDGMERQLDVLSNLGLLSRFVGMVTDSRSFLSYARHEYFRRILCNKLGDEIKRGLLPNDMKLIGNMVRDICYRNAENYFGF